MGNSTVCLMYRHKVALAAHLWLRSEGGDLLVIRRGETSYLSGYWSVPAGHVDADETVTQACVREAREEIGVDLRIEDLRFVLVQQKTACDGEERVDFFFEAILPDGQRAHIADSREVADLAWVAPARLPAPFAPYVLAALEARGRSLTLSTWGYDLSCCCDQCLGNCSMGLDRRHRSRNKVSKDLASGYCAAGVSTRCGMSQPWFGTNSAGTFR